MYVLGRGLRIRQDLIGSAWRNRHKGEPPPSVRVILNRGSRTETRRFPGHVEDAAALLLHGPSPEECAVPLLLLPLLAADLGALLHQPLPNGCHQEAPQHLEQRALPRTLLVALATPCAKRAPKSSKRAPDVVV